VEETHFGEELVKKPGGGGRVAGYMQGEEG